MIMLIKVKKDKPNKFPTPLEIAEVLFIAKSEELEVTIRMSAIDLNFIVY